MGNLSYTICVYTFRFIISLCALGVISGVVGVLLGFCVQVFITILYGVENGESFVSAVTDVPNWFRVLIPTLGGLVVGLIVYLAKAPEIMGEGVPAVKTVLNQDEVIRHRTGPLKFLATSITLGTGGSAGREGPIIQIGASIGTTVARVMKLSARDRSVVLLAGAAGAMAAAFGTPAAALVFVVEILRRQIDYRAVVALVSTVVIASVLARVGFGYTGLTLPEVPVLPFMISDIPVYVLVGVLAGLVAVLFTVLLRLTHELFPYLVPSLLIRPAIGGFLVGLIALYLPYVHEPAMKDIFSSTIAGTLPVVILLLILITKVFATVLTVGSGGSGGIFAPSLVLGFVLGGIVMHLGSVIGLTVPVAVVYVAMAAMFAAAAHAPLTGMFILYELTGLTDLVMPLVIATVCAYLVARFIVLYSMYSIHNSK